MPSTRASNNCAGSSSIRADQPNVVSFVGLPLPSAVDNVRHILSDSDDHDISQLDGQSLLTQLDVLVHFNDGTASWKEISRWLKYLETIEVGDRWSKPHVPTTSMHGILELKKALIDGTCLVGMGMQARRKGDTIADIVANLIESEGHLTENTCRSLRDVITYPHKHSHRKLEKKSQNAEAAEHVISDSEDANQSRLRKRMGHTMDIASALYSLPTKTTQDSITPYKPNKKLARKLPKNCEAANILVGEVDFLPEVVMAFCRLELAVVMADLTEVDIPTRFVFLVLGPKNGQENAIWEFTEIGRAMASLLNDKVFCHVAYNAKNAVDLISGIDEYLDSVTVLPPSIWDPSTRLPPPKHTISMDKILHRLDESMRGPNGPVSDPQEEGAGDDKSLIRSGKLFGGLINDIKHRYKQYGSDLKDGLHPQCLASTIFLFFACITPIVTFGGLLGQKTDGYLGTMETLMSGAICGVLYALFSGQPLTIVGATGPLLIFESILYHICHENQMDFMSLRFWIGAWVTVILLLIVAFDLSALVRYITRFTEESFAVLISLIFIYEAFDKIREIWENDPVRIGVVREDEQTPWLYHCFCTPVNNSHLFVNFSRNGAGLNVVNYFNWTSLFDENCITNNKRLQVRTGCISESSCVDSAWNLTGHACYQKYITHSVPDVFFVSIILFLGTFALAYTFRTFRTSRFFPTIVRTTVADFAVFLSVLTWTGIDYYLGLRTPKLDVPAEFKPTRANRSWLVNPLAVTYWWLIPLCVVPALLATILVFLDQQITAVIVNRKEHKLKKGHGYHLDLLVLSLLILICSALGLPWFVAATVRAITHVKSLMRESEVKIPGERPYIVGVREQRVTGVCIHLLIGLATQITSVLRIIPMPVLYGVFMYMGVTSLGGVQFVQRILILFMPVKYQPDYIFLRHVRSVRVHMFTAAQIVCMATMWITKTIKLTSIAFPLLLIALMAVRKAMDYVFTQSDLYWLDHLLPDETRREKEDAAAKKKCVPANAKQVEDEFSRHTDKVQISTCQQALQDECTRSNLQKIVSHL